ANLSERMNVNQLGILLKYTLDEKNPDKPLTNLVNVAIERATRFNGPNLLRAWTERALPLSWANEFIDSVHNPPSGILLSHLPTLSDLKKHLHQTPDQKERNLVMTVDHEAFLVPGISRVRGNITYRSFPNLSMDIHTHPVDWAFSTGDLI